MNWIRLLPMLAVAMSAACTSRASGPSANATPASQVLVASGERVRGAMLSPDGTQVAYWQPADSGSQYTLMVARGDFRDPRPTRWTSPSGGDNIQWSPDGTRLAADLSGTVVVFGLRDTLSRQYVAPDGGLVQIVDWHPAGDRLVVLETGRASTMRGALLELASGRFTPLVPGERRPHTAFVHPDGRRVLFMRLDGGKTTLWVADSIGGVPRALTTEGFEEWGASWPVTPAASLSPDGSELLYLSRRTGRMDLYAVPLAGGTARQITRDIHDDYFGRWSRDGRFIAFVSTRGGQTDLWRVPREGGDATRLTDSRDVELPLGWQDSGAFVYSTESMQAGLVAAALDGASERVVLSDSLRIAYGWQLSPDRRLVAATREMNGGADLLVAAIDSGPMRTLVHDDCCVFDLSWAPDSRTLALALTRAGSIDAWTAEVTTGALTRFTTWPEDERYPVFSRDGARLYFTSGRDAAQGDVWTVGRDGKPPVRATTSGNVLDLISGRGGPLPIASIQRAADGAFVPARLTASKTAEPLWQGPGTLNSVAVSPRGDSLAMLIMQPSGDELRLVSTTNGGGRLLRRGRIYPRDLSPDGRRLLVSYRNGALRDLAVIDLNNGRWQPVVTTPGTDEFEGAFLADPNTIVFRRERPTRQYLGVTPPL